MHIAHAVFFFFFGGGLLISNAPLPRARGKSDKTPTAEEIYLVVPTRLSTVCAPAAHCQLGTLAFPRILHIQAS